MNVFFGRREPDNLLNSDAVESFFEALDHLDAAQLTSMRTVWKSIGSEAHEAAWAAASTVATRDGLGRSVERIRNRAIEWAKRGSNRPAHDAPDDATWIQTKLEASEAIVDVALAVALGDRLDTRTRAILLAPWADRKGLAH